MVALPRATKTTARRLGTTDSGSYVALSISALTMAGPAEISGDEFVHPTNHLPQRSAVRGEAFGPPPK
jgi:hypothetical protein